MLKAQGLIELNRGPLGFPHVQIDHADAGLPRRILCRQHDHARQAVLYLPKRMPEPREPSFLTRAMEEIEALLDITGGRAFLLFTSHAVLSRAREHLGALDRFPLFVQGEGSKAALLQAFKTTPRAVLLGTNSFWHGVDVPGEALSLVVIDKPERTQTQIILGRPALKGTNPDHLAMNVAVTSFGGTFTAPLMHEVREGRGSPRGGVLLDVSHLPAATVKKKLPSMYDQFHELAGVDITTEPMEVGPTCHYFMGGISVEADTGATTVPGLFAAGECSGGMNGANRLGGNSLSDLLVFGKRTGEHAARAAAEAGAVTIDAEQVADAAAEMDGYLSGSGDDPYALHAELQATMQEGVGIYRDATGLSTAVPALSFEYLAAAPEVALACVDRLAALGRYEYNWSAGERHRLAERGWLAPDAIRAFLVGLRPGGGSGDVYAVLRP